MSGLVQTNQIIKLPYAATTISVVDTGKIFLTPQTAAGVSVTYTLPSAASGLHYRFINVAAGALSGSVNITGADGMFGSVISGPTGGVAFLSVQGNATLRFVTALSIIGDYIDLIGANGNWYIEARSQVAAGVIAA